MPELAEGGEYWRRAGTWRLNIILPGSSGRMTFPLPDLSLRPCPGQTCWSRWRWWRLVLSPSSWDKRRMISGIISTLWSSPGSLPSDSSSGTPSQDRPMWSISEEEKNSIWQLRWGGKSLLQRRSSMLLADTQVGVALSVQPVDWPSGGSCRL